MYTAMYTLPLSAPVAPWLHLTTVTGAPSSSIPRKRASLWRGLTLLDLEPDVGVGDDGEAAPAADLGFEFGGHRASALALRGATRAARAGGERARIIDARRPWGACGSGAAEFLGAVACRKDRADDRGLHGTVFE